MKDTTNEFPEIRLINIIKGLLTSLIVTICASFISAAILVKTSDPTSYLQIISVVIIYLSFIIGSIFSSCKTQSPVFNSTIYALSHLLLIVIISIVLPKHNNNLPLTQTLISYIGAPVTSILTTYFMFVKTTKRSYHKKRRIR